MSKISRLISSDQKLIQGIGSTYTRNGTVNLFAALSVFFYYPPTSASWLNMVEIWFGILTRKSLRKKSFSSTGELAAHIEAFTAAYNETARPFVWKKREAKGSQLKNIARNFNN